MKSITACPHCNTQFLVDDEQLSQYKGKVRCGNCLNVFNAVDYFVQSEPTDAVADIAVERAKPEAEKTITPTVAAPATLKEATAETTVPDVVEETIIPEAIDTVSNESQPNEIEETSQADSTDNDTIDQAYIDKTQSLIENINVDQFKVDIDPEIDVVPEADNGTATKEPSFSVAPDPVASATDKSSMATDEHQSASSNDYADYDLPPEPNFSSNEQINNSVENTENIDEAANLYLKEKQPAPLWVKLLILLFIVALIGQVIYFMRDKIAQTFPEAKSVLQKLCQPIGCKINLPREIHLFSIDDSGIQEDAERQDVIRLTSTITNRADFNQAYPDLEVTLTDTKDKPKIRRVFKSAEYLPKTLTIADGISPGESVSIDMPLMTDDVKVAGFRILLTYDKQ